MDSIYILIDQIERESGIESVRCGTAYALPKGGQAMITAVGEDRLTIELIVPASSERTTLTGGGEPVPLHQQSDFYGPVNLS